MEGRAQQSSSDTENAVKKTGLISGVPAFLDKAAVQVSSITTYMYFSGSQRGCMPNQKCF